MRMSAQALFVASGVALLTLIPVGRGDAAELPEAPPPVVLIGASGLTWDDVDEERTPAVAAFTQAAAIGHLSVRSVYRVTCPTDAWLTIGAARRAAADREPKGDDDEVVDLDATCPPIPQVVDGRVDGWGELVAFNASLNYGAQLGLLGDSARETGTTVLAAGAGGALGAADSGGKTVEYLADPLEVTERDLASANISLIDLGGVDERADPTTRLQQVEAIDADIAEVLAKVPEGATVILLAGANSRPAADLQIIAIRGEGFAPGLLTSTSTRQEGLVLLTDVTPTLFELSGMPPAPDFVGAPVTSVPRNPEASFEERQQDLVDETRKVRVNGDVAPAFFISVIALQLVFYSWVAYALRRPGRSERSTLRTLCLTLWVAIVCSAIPVGTFLANLLPWWTWGPAHLGLVALVLLWACGVALVAHWVGRGRDLLAEVGMVSAVTVGVLAGDIVTGGSLQTASLMGYSPVIAGRLYGLGNVAFALFATALVFLAAWCGGYVYRPNGAVGAARAVLGIGVIGLVVGLPTFGSDFGGMLAMATGFGVFYLGARGRRSRSSACSLSQESVSSSLPQSASSTGSRPPESRSHLGEFVQQVLDGEFSDIVARKLENNLDILVNSALAALVLLVVSFWRRCCCDRSTDLRRS